MIRRYIAVLILVVLIFNMGGYFILYGLLERRAESVLSARILNGDIDLQERIEIKVPFELPYPVYAQQIEPADDRIKTDKITYTVTSHSYSDNMLTVVGVRDQWATHVDAVMSAFNKAASGDVDPDGIIHGISGLFSSFISHDPVTIIHLDSWVRLLNRRAPAEDFPAIDLPVIPKPPCA